MWGTQKPQGTYPSKRRFISTCCGKNDYFRAVATVLRTPSPRVWGPLAALRTVLKSPGSSPRMRGTLSPPRCRFPTKGLIPTYAGNTWGGGGLPAPGWAHPHVCGEHICCGLSSSGLRGSSPRMRGTLSQPKLQLHSPGLIPTYAGNTSPRLLACRRSGAHPHVCGEHLPLQNVPNPLRGSSPRMRGTPVSHRKFGVAVGLIPTYAGNTLI